MGSVHIVPTDFRVCRNSGPEEIVTVLADDILKDISVKFVQISIQNDDKTEKNITVTQPTDLIPNANSNITFPLETNRGIGRRIFHYGTPIPNLPRNRTIYSRICKPGSPGIGTHPACPKRELIAGCWKKAIS